MNRLTLEGATAVVTGGARGIGRSIATELARSGANIVVADISRDAAEQTAQELAAFGVRTRGEAVDVSDADQVRELADRTFGDFGSVDVLVNNAGVTMRPFRAIWEASIDDYRWMLDVNYLGVVHGVLAFVPRMREQSNRRHIVNTSSAATISRNTGHAMYGAAKAAVDALSDTLREEFRDHDDDIGVTVLYPGFITTTIAQTSELTRPTENRSDERHVVEYPHLDKRAPEPFHVPLAPEKVGPMLLRALAVNAPYCTTHQFTTDFLDARAQAVAAGFFPESGV